MDLKGKRLLVTGGRGFLGRALCAELKERGVEELIVPRRKEYNLTEQAETRRLFAESAPQVVIHLAAEVGGIGANRAHPGRYFYANAAMGLSVIEECRRSGVEKIVQVGTVCAYPKHASVPFNEGALWDGYPEETNAPYGVAKKSLLVMLKGYWEEYGLSGVYLLPSNLYGPGDNFDLESSHVIPALIRKFVGARDRGDRRVTVWGSGKASREFLYVEDAARGLADATEYCEEPEPINLGVGREVSIAELVQIISALVGYEGEVEWDRSKPDGQPRRMLETSRAKEAFGFEPRVGLEEGLRRTIYWWEKFSGGT